MNSSYTHLANLILDRPPRFGDAEQIAEVKRHNEIFCGRRAFATLQPQRGFQHEFYAHIRECLPQKRHNCVYIEFDCQVCRREIQLYSETALRVDPRFWAHFICQDPENTLECECGTEFTPVPRNKTIDVYIKPEGA